MSGRKGFWGWFTSTFPPPKPGGLAWKAQNGVTNLHVWLYGKTKGRVLGDFDGAPLCVLHSRGARTGAPRSTPMIYLRDGQRMVIVASIGGNPRNPAWYHNLLAHPEIEIEADGRRSPMRARLASEAEAEALWPRLLEMWPAWSDYMKRTDRVFPVFICEPREA